jgi:hypothetical protein
MTLKDALPDLKIEGKPQCHIIAIAKEQRQVVASVGCALSRARTGMRPEEMTCAIPGSGLAEVVEALERAVSLDRMMASYAAADAKRIRPVCGTRGFLALMESAHTGPHNAGGHTRPVYRSG